GGDRLVGANAGCVEIVLNLRVIVPDLGVDVELHVANAARDQASSHQAAPGVGIGGLFADSVHGQRLFALFRDIRRVAGIHLEPGGQLVAGNACVQLKLTGVIALVNLVEPAQ